MTLNDKKTVSWQEAYRVGLSVAVNQKIFTLIALFSIICERSISFFIHFNDISLTVVAHEYKKMAILFSKDPLGETWSAGQFPELNSFLPIAAVFFFLGVFFFIGILGLMRDLMVRHGYKTQDIFARGKRYLWPVIRFKVPLYLLLGIVQVILLLWVLSVQGTTFQLSTQLLIAVSLYGFVFFIARIFLSLGPKVIVTETETIKQSFLLCKRIMKLVVPHLGQILVFYILMLVAVGFSLVLPFWLGRLTLPFVPLTIITLLTVSFLTIALKASSFCLYLQLRHTGAGPHTIKNKRVENNITEVKNG
ncbi:MAG: hypothetical protein GY757_18095 [bacterium]|nr:hypothetical protein [bacterium]